MTTPAENPAPRTPHDNDGCPQWLGSEPCLYVAQKSPSFPAFIRACSCCGRIHFGDLARDLADAGYVVVPQAELDERIRDAFVHAVAVGMAAERIGCEEADLLAEAEQKVAATDAHFERQRATAGPEGPRGGGEAIEPQTGAESRPWYEDPDTIRAFAIDRYRSTVKGYTDEHGKSATPHEQTLLLIGYTTGWDDHASGRMGEEAAASERILQAIESVEPCCSGCSGSCSCGDGA